MVNVRLRLRLHIMLISSIRYVEAICKDTVASYERASFFELVEEFIIADGLGGALELIEELTHPPNRTDDRPFEEVAQ